MFSPGVVVIDVTKKPSLDGEGSDVFPDFFHQTPPKDSDALSPNHRAGPSSEGSGFVIQSSGYILTNNHVRHGRG